MDALMETAKAAGGGYDDFSRFVDRRSSEQKEVEQFFLSGRTTLDKALSVEQKKKMVHEKAQSYEAFFMGRLFQPLFEGLSKNAFGGGAGEEIWQGMLAQEYAKNAVQTGQGIGLTEKIEAQMFARMGLQQDLDGLSGKDLPRKALRLDV